MLDQVLNYVESDAPTGVTLVEWRRSRVGSSRRRRLRLRTLVGGRRPPAFAV
jgi:hypothetical protein